MAIHARARTSYTTLASSALTWRSDEASRDVTDFLFLGNSEKGEASRLGVVRAVGGSWRWPSIAEASNMSPASPSRCLRRADTVYITVRVPGLLFAPNRRTTCKARPADKHAFLRGEMRGQALALASAACM